MMINRWKRIAIIISLLIGYVSLDQLTKYLAKKMLVSDSVIRFLGDTLRLQYAENKGIYLSLGSSLPDEIRFWLFIVGVSILLTFLLIFLIFFKNLPSFPTIALTLILCGGVGNLIDRIFNQGIVIDMFNIGIGNLRTGIFNLADLAVTIGGGMMLYYLLFIEGKQHTSSPGKAEMDTAIFTDKKNDDIDEL